MTAALRPLAVAGHDPLVLIVPAAGIPVGAYRPVAEALGDRVDVVGVDPPGHGGAPAADGDPWAAAADAVRAALESAGRDRRVAVVAHSGGAAAVLEAAEGAPLDVVGCFLFEPAARPRREDAENPMVERTRRRRAVWADRAAAEEYFAATRPYAAFDPRARAAFLDTGLIADADGALHLACPPDVEAELYRTAPARPVWDDLSRIAQEITVAAGADPEPGTLAALAPDLVARLAAGRLQTVDGAGHFLPLDDPTRFADLVGTWLASKGITR